MPKAKGLNGALIHRNQSGFPLLRSAISDLRYDMPTAHDAGAQAADPALREVFPIAKWVTACRPTAANLAQHLLQSEICDLLSEIPACSVTRVSREKPMRPSVREDEGRVCMNSSGGGASEPTKRKDSLKREQYSGHDSSLRREWPRKSVSQASRNTSLPGRTGQRLERSRPSRIHNA